MMKYKFIFLVASSNRLMSDNPYYGNDERYDNFKIVNKLYYDKFKNDIKFFYVEYKENIENDVIEIDDYIYVKGNDLPIHPNFTIKMIKSSGYIHDTYEYDYIIHTNLSSIWNIPLLLSLYNEIPRNNFFGGHYIFDWFITGTGIFFSYDLIPFLLKIDTDKYNDSNDVSISAYMKDNCIPIFRVDTMPNYRWELAISNQYTNTQYDNILYFRIKNSSSEIDITISKFILNNLYNITV
jgi:hypothetical protein